MGRIYAELDTLKEEIRGLKQMVGEVVTRIRPTIQTEHPHIVRVEGIHGGEPIIKGTGISVRTIVERTRLGDKPEQIVDDYPYLTLAQVYDALSYYHEHPQEIEQYIAENKAVLCKTPKSVSSSLEQSRRGSKEQRQIFCAPLFLAPLLLVSI